MTKVPGPKKVYSFRLSEEAAANLMFCQYAAGLQMDRDDFYKASQSEVVSKALERLARYYSGLKLLPGKGGGKIKKEITPRRE